MTQRQPMPALLVIEDDEATREFLELFLNISGYHVRMAESGSAGLKAATSGPVSAILLDRRLPDMDGLTVCQRLRELLPPDVPIIMLTADHDLSLEAMARAAGISGFLRKPFQPDMLLARLNALLHR